MHAAIRKIATEVTVRSLMKLAEDRRGYSGSIPPSVWVNALDKQMRIDQANRSVDFNRGLNFRDLVTSKMLASRDSAARGVDQGLDGRDGGTPTYTDLLRQQAPELYDRIAPYIKGIGDYRSPNFSQSIERQTREQYEDAKRNAKPGYIAPEGFGTKEYYQNQVRKGLGKFVKTW